MILLTILAFFACACIQGTSTWWRWATDPYRLSPWVNSVHAVMSGTARKCFTMQGFGTPVSALGQGGKTGSPMSSSCNHSSSSMGNLVYGESYATKKKTLGFLNAHNCHKNVNSFCYICTRYEVNWVPYIICNSCRLMLYRSRNSGFQKYCRFSTPAIWKQLLRMKDCYFCIGFPTMFATTVKNKANGSIKR